MHKYFLFIIAFIAFIVGVSFLFRTSNPSLHPSSMLKGHTVTYNNKPFLEQKLQQSDFFKKSGISNLTITLSAVEQPNVVAQRLNEQGNPEVSMAYNLKRSNDSADLMLYVNPSMYPLTDPGELERQYSQLALIAIYNISHPGQSQSPRGLQLFIKDYRDNMGKNVIFTIK